MHLRPDFRSLAFDAVSIAAVLLVQPYLFAGAGRLAAVLHDLSLGLAIVASIGLGVAFFPALLLPFHGSGEEAGADGSGTGPGGARGRLDRLGANLHRAGQVVLVASGAFCLFMVPPLCAEAMAAEPPTGGAAIGMIFGLLVLNVVVGAVAASALLELRGCWSEAGGRRFDRLLGTAYWGVVLPAAIWFVAVAEVHPVVWGPLFAFRAGLLLQSMRSPLGWLTVCLWLVPLIASRVG